MQDNSEKWKEAMDAEYNMLVQQGTWTPSLLPPCMHAIQTKWVYKRNFADGGNNLYKARLVAKGFVQQPYVDYGDTYALVSSLVVVRCLLTVVAARRLVLW